jgi:hypothetical protein
MSDEQDQLVVLSSTLAITRDQLSRSMGLNAELEAILDLERKRNDSLLAQIQDLQAAAAAKDASTSEDSSKK